MILEDVKTRIAWNFCRFQVWKGQFDLLWHLYEYKQFYPSKHMKVVISTWIIEEESNFDAVVRKVVGNNASIERAIIDTENGHTYFRTHSFRDR